MKTEPPLPKHVWFSKPTNCDTWVYCYGGNGNSVVFLDESWPAEAVEQVLKHMRWRKEQWFLSAVTDRMTSAAWKAYYHADTNHTEEDMRLAIAAALAVQKEQG